ncbi:hemolysin family protein [Sphingomonas sp.]|jgi:putative hemolysin|uniref:hemolysin family protein n=1 Tax=Sphingomonas sp. TaxID=28214 RepID=UPI002E32DE37|nr:hemolysin family protein [Sphingomonas sp.]HEX4692909.1 hemolysin family protein [Sphingomonas sp.]
MAPAPPLDPFPWIDVVIILVLVAVNGVFAMTEMAIASSRKARLEAMARTGSRGARAAIDLAADPGKFLSTAQVGITLIAVLSGAYSGEALGGPVAARLELAGMSHDSAGTVGFVLVIGLTTFVSLIVGELVPKQFALRSPEPIAAVMAIPMTWLSRIAAPLVWLLDSTSGLLFRLAGLSRDSEDQVTAEELHLIVAEASKSGVIEEHERSIISGVVRLADRPVREVMTPRTEVDWLDSSLDDIGIRAKLAGTQHTRLPVADGSIDAVIGVVQARDIVAAAIKGEPLDLKVLMRAAPVVIDQLDAMDALVRLRRAPVPMALIHDEYGHFEGIVTPADLLAAIAGEFASDADPNESPDFVHRDDGSYLVAGSASADLLAEKLDLDLPDDRDYATAAGFALAAFRRLPGEGESVVEQGWTFEVVDLDGRRIDKLLVTRAREGR